MLTKIARESAQLIAGNRKENLVEKGGGSSPDLTKSRILAQNVDPERNRNKQVYIAEPFDDRLYYQKVGGQIKKTLFPNDFNTIGNTVIDGLKCTIWIV